MTGSDLKDRVTILALQMGGDGWAWVPTVPTWAKVVQEDRKNYFSDIGLGARSATITMRRRPLDLHQALRWRGKHLVLTSIVEEEPGWITVKAAVVPLRLCRMDADRAQMGAGFPAILTEKYVRHDSPDLHSELDGLFVLVTPKAVKLEPGSWVTVENVMYQVEAVHELDEYKNEYEIRQERDC